MSSPRFVPAEKCWCGWQSATDSSRSDHYFDCERCGAQYSKARLHPDDYLSFYSYETYWQNRQRQKEHPILEERAEVLLSGGRIETWLSTIEKHNPSPAGLAIEVGCAEGTFLKELSSKGWQTLGIEPDPETARRAKSDTGLDIRSGIFPEVDLPTCNLLVACDVLEHVGDPVGFVKGAANVLDKDGILFLQQPLLESDQGFGEMTDRVFDPEEHAFIFTRKSLAALLHANGFDVLENDSSWSVAHEILVAKKRRVEASKEPKLLANLAETFSEPYTSFIEKLNTFGRPFGLREFCNWSKIWEYPHIWHEALHSVDWTGKHLVDIGSERSPWPWFIASLGAKVTIVEASAEWIKHWESIRASLDLNVDWAITPSCEIPIASESADYVTSFSVLEHQSDKSKAIDEMVRVLKPSGCFGVSFDVIVDGYGMSYPEWGGSAWTLEDFKSTLLERSDLEPLEPLSWNLEDVRPFLEWHRTTAPHHNYVCAAASFRKAPE